MKNIAILLLLLGLVSCTYDYEMPDYSNIRPTYHIEMSDDIKTEWEQIASKYLPDAKKINIEVTERDKNGNILYRGTARKEADYSAYDLEVTAICITSAFTEPYEICRFKLPTKYPLRISPGASVIKIDTNTDYSIELPPISERITAYDISYDSEVESLIKNTIEKIYHTFYTFEKSEIIITENDENGDILYQGNKESSVSQKGTKTVNIAIEIYGIPKGGNYPITQMGILKFEDPIDLEDLTSQKKILTANMKHAFTDLLPESEWQYAYDIDCDNSIEESIYKQMELMGHDRIRNIEMLIKEKDGAGNVIRTINKKNGISISETSEKGAKSVEICIDFYGWMKDSYNDVKLGTLAFDETLELKEIAGKKTKLTANTPHTFIDLLYIYNVEYAVDIRAIMNDAAKTLGYEILDCKINVIEKDKVGNILYKGVTGGSLGYHTSARGTETVEVFIDFYGWPKGIYGEKIKIGTITFHEKFSIEEFQNKTLILDTSNSYTMDLMDDFERIYNYHVTYGSDVTSLIIKTLESMGYEIAGNKILITEKDENGNIINQKYKPNGDEPIYSSKGAVTVEFAIEIEGRPKGSYDNKSIVCSLIFEETFDLKAINNQTLTLTTNMPYSISTEKDIFSIKQKKYEVPSIGGSIQVEVISSNEYSIQLPIVNWVSETTSKTTNTNVHVFTISTNNSSEKRKTAIIFIDNKSGVTEQVTIVQLGNSNDNTTDGNIDGMPIEPW